VKKTFLRRYTDIPALVYLLREQKLTLLDPQTWDDANDSHYLSLYQQANKLKSVLALCFTQTGETYHHWRVFANGSGGVCVSFKRAELLKAVKQTPGLRMDSVTYLKLQEIRGTKPAVEELPFLKRYPFEDEKEFRMIYASKTKSLSAFDIDIPLTCIDKITLSPWLHPSLSSSLRQFLHSVDGCDSVRIHRSTLIGNEEWKELGDSVAEVR
jgi:hypothetical protein